MANRSYILRPGDAYRWNHDWLIDRDDGFYQKGISRSYTALTTGTHSGQTSIVLAGATEEKSNACVQDNRTGLMWSKTPSGTVGPGADGRIHWNDHVDVLTFSSSGFAGGYVAGELLTQAVTGETAQIEYVDDARFKIGVLNPSTDPFGFGNTVSSPTGGPDIITAWAQGNKEDIWAYITAINNSSFAGYSDWRIPNVFEQMSIMEYSVDKGNATPSTSYFTMPADTSDIIWTGTHEGPHYRTWRPAAFNPNWADAVRFDTGLPIWGTSSFKCDDVGHVYVVRGPGAGTYPCVLFTTGSYAGSGFPDDAFYRKGAARDWTLYYTLEATVLTANDGTSLQLYNSTVTDNLTGLVWTRGMIDDPMPYYDNDGQRLDAVDAVLLFNEQNHGGRSDWRIPNIFEVMTIMTSYWHQAPTYFYNYDEEFWTCTPDPTDADKVLYYDPGGPYFSSADRQTGGSKYVRLVAGGYTDDDL